MTRPRPMRFHRGPYAIEMTHESGYSFGSTDNPRSFQHEYAFASRFISSMHAIVCFEREEVRGSAVLGASGGATGVHERSCVLLDDRCFVAVGDHVACLALPDLSLVWQVQGDDVTCFGLHVSVDQRFLVVHGELEIRKLTLDGQTEWAFAGRDIFTGDCVVSHDTVLVTDFDGDRYSIDLATGLGRRV